MSDPWAPPDRPYDPWGAPPGYDAHPTRRAWVVGLAVVVPFLVGVGVTAVALRPHPARRGAGGAAAVHATRPPRPSPRPGATRSPARPTPRPGVPARTYSAPPGGVPVTGRVLDPAGRPVRDASVSMSRHEGIIEGLGRAFVMVGSLGFACFTEICEIPYGRARTDESGRFTLYLERDVDDYDVTVTRGGTTMSVKVDFASKPLPLGDVVLWSTSPRLERSGTTARVRFATLPSRAGSVDSYDVTVTQQGSEPLVRIADAHDGAAFDVRVLEDVSATLAVTASVHTRLGTATYSGVAGVRGTYRPVSRGRACVEYGSAGSRRTSPCGLTDGLLGREWGTKGYAGICSSKRGTTCDPSVAVDLGSVRAIRFVTLQGCDTFFDTVTASNDGVHWRTLIPKGDSSEGCAAAVGGTARYVRVEGAFYTTRREIAVF